MKILLGGAGGAPTNNVIKSLRQGGSADYLIGMSSVPSDLLLADVNERWRVPPALDSNFPTKLAEIVKKTRPKLLHSQHDFEVRAISRVRRQLQEAGVTVYLPEPDTIENTVDKGKSYNIWKQAGVPVPETRVVFGPRDLRQMMDSFDGKIWIRATEGGGGKGSLPVRNNGDYDFARLWIDRFNGWGRFTAAEMLTANSVTWLSIWYLGELVVAQTRKRLSWNFGDRTLSGVTGVTGVAETCSCTNVTNLAISAIKSIDSRPHGVFGVDMTYDFNQSPRVTEINIGRFFTTVHFFTKAGVNFPQIYRDIALENKFPSLSNKINPLPNGLVWIRGMDVEPVLTTTDQLEKSGL